MIQKEYDQKKNEWFIEEKRKSDLIKRNSSY
jgi:hypothetical protein